MKGLPWSHFDQLAWPNSGKSYTDCCRPRLRGHAYVTAEDALVILRSVCCTNQQGLPVRRRSAGAVAPRALVAPRPGDRRRRTHSWTVSFWKICNDIYTHITNYSSSVTPCKYPELAWSLAYKILRSSPDAYLLSSEIPNTYLARPPSMAGSSIWAW